MKRVATWMLGAAFALLAAGVAGAPSWPAKPIRWIVPFAPGGTTDILARTISDKLTIALGKPVIVENNPGAGGGVGAVQTAKAAPDGYTIMGGTISTHAINASLYKTLPYDPVKDFTPITLIARVPNLLVVNPDVPAKNVKELIALMKANPSKYTFASSGNGTSQHLSGELFKSMAGVDMQHIPYKGSPAALQDVVSGQVTMTFDNITTCGRWPRPESCVHLRSRQPSARRLRLTCPHSPKRDWPATKSARGRACSHRRAHRSTSSSASTPKS